MAVCGRSFDLTSIFLVGWIFLFSGARSAFKTFSDTRDFFLSYWR
jgi:hypothetical protein